MRPVGAVLLFPYPDMTKTPVALASGDDIGPGITNATPRALETSGAALDIETFDGQAGFTLARGR